MSRSRTWWMPWRVLGWVDRMGIWCWASLVAWKHLGGDRPSRNTRCVWISEHEGHTCLTCYCGYWDAPERNQCPVRREAPHA